MPLSRCALRRYTPAPEGVGRGVCGGGREEERKRGGEGSVSHSLPPCLPGALLSLTLPLSRSLRRFPPRLSVCSLAHSLSPVKAVMEAFPSFRRLSLSACSRTRSLQTFPLLSSDSAWRRRWWGKPPSLAAAAAASRADGVRGLPQTAGVTTTHGAVTAASPGAP